MCPGRIQQSHTFRFGFWFRCQTSSVRGATSLRSVWRNWIARGTSNPKVAGSNPVTDSLIFFSLFYLHAEHEDLVQWKNT